MDATSFYLTLGGILFTIGAFGVLVRRNAIVLFMCIELMLNAVNLTLIALSQHSAPAGSTAAVDAQIYVFFIMAIAAAEAAVGLAIIISVFRNYFSIDSGEVHLLKG